MQKIRQGDFSVISGIYRECYDNIEYMIVSKSGNAMDAEDIFQEAVMVLYENSKKPDFHLSSSIKTFLYSVSRNLWYNQLRKRGRLVSLPDDYEPDEAYHLPQDEPDERIEAVLKCIGSLGEKCKAILQLYYFDEMDMAGIALQLQYTNADNVKAQKYKCFVQLKKCVFGEK